MLEAVSKAGVKQMVAFNYRFVPAIVQARKLIESGAVALHGAYFGVANGELSVLDRGTGEFRPVMARPPR
jgi:hypothetical protein